MSNEAISVPPHVPRDRIYDFNLFTDPRLMRDPQRSLVSILHEAPPIFYTPRNGGHWMVTRSADALEILRQPENFSSDPQYNWNYQRKPRTIPNQYDPPDHSALRQILNPFFSPGAMKRGEPKIRAYAIDLIDEVIRSGKVEFVSQIAQRFPVQIFLDMAGSPQSDGERVMKLADGFVRNTEREDRLKAMEVLGDYLNDEFARRRRAPGEDLLSHLLKATFNGRPLDDDELSGAGTILFLGGLDTTASALSFTMNFLGRNPGHYQRLVADPDFIPAAVEELLRAHGGAMFERGVTHDMEYKGLALKKGERLVFLSHFYGYDDDEVPDPLKIDFDREISRHMIFGAGPHRCLGSHLARIEIRVFLEEWVKRVPEFSVIGDLVSRPGVVWMPVDLHLVWRTD